MARGHRPPPLNLSVDCRPKTLPHISRTPSWSKDVPLPSPRIDDKGRSTRQRRDDPLARTLRIARDFLHIVACMLLIFVLAVFLGYYPGAVSSTNGPHSVLLIVVLAVDVGLDFRSIGLYDRPWTCWPFLARSLVTLAYVGVVVAYLAVRRVFPDGYSYWNIPSRYSSGPVLGLLCAILAWNTVQLVLIQSEVRWDALRGLGLGRGGQTAATRARIRGLPALGSRRPRWRRDAGALV